MNKIIASILASLTLAAGLAAGGLALSGSAPAAVNQPAPASSQPADGATGIGEAYSYTVED